MYTYFNKSCFGNHALVLESHCLVVTQAKHCIVFCISMTKSQSNLYWNRCIPSFHSVSAFWANGKQNSGLVNFILELFLPFPHCISSIYHKMAGKAEDSSVKMECEFLFGTSRAGKQDNLFRSTLLIAWPLMLPKLNLCLFHLRKNLIPYHLSLLM